jgi:2-oxoglutarate ferredoxin oxidoreductase subunit alpha
VVVVVDKILCEDNQSYEPFDTSSYVVDRGKYVDHEEQDYQRYTLSSDGISPRSPVGVGNYLNANADEHDSNGYSSEDHQNRIEQMNKRMQKLETCRKTHMRGPRVFGPGDAKVTLVSWGSNKGSILEAMKQLPDVNYIHLTWMNPFPADELTELLNKASYLIDIECNYTAHMRSLIREHTGIRIEDTMLRFDGRPIYPEQIVEKVRSVILERGL